MGVLYYLHDPAKGECFEFGKGWLGQEEDTEKLPKPKIPGGVYIGRMGYDWMPLESEQEALAYCARVFNWIDERSTRDEATEHDMYVCRVTQRLWAWLQGRDQYQLYVQDDCSSDDIRCTPERHDNFCAEYLESAPYLKHFWITGSRYEEKK